MGVIARHGLLCALLLVAAAPMRGDPGSPAGSMRRFSLVIGANDGGPGRERLRYAVSDAKAVIQVLEGLGGIAPDDSRLLLEPRREALLWEMGRLRERLSRLRPSQPRLEALFYYSGHADADGLLLGRERVSYRELRGWLDGLDADARVVILDSCASGAFIRFKGGRARPPFMLDAAFAMKGYAVMTSSSADEASQESERVRGSFFTRALLTGLRGAADASADGRVTLSEAYQYAFAETLRQTERASGGPQHPSYDIQMSGTGDVVLTDLRSGDARLRLGRGLAGRVFIHDRSGTLVMEFPKAAEAELEVELARGRYRLVVVDESEVREAEVEVTGSGSREVGEGRFSRTEILDAIARGDREARRQNRPDAGKRLHFHAQFIGKMSRYEGRWTFMPGMQLGGRLGESLAFGLVGFGRVGAGAGSRPPFWGLAIDYPLLKQGRFGVRLRTVAGMMRSDGEDERSRRYSLVIEPGVGAAWALSHRFNLVVQASLDFVDGANDDLRRFSLGLGLELCRQ